MTSKTIKATSDMHADPQVTENDRKSTFEHGQDAAPEHDPESNVTGEPHQLESFAARIPTEIDGDDQVINSEVRLFSSKEEAERARADAMATARHERDVYADPQAAEPEPT